MTENSNSSNPVYTVRYQQGTERSFEYDSDGSLLKVHQPGGETWQRVAEDLWRTPQGLIESQVKVNQEGSFSYTHWVGDEFVKSTTFASGNTKDSPAELRGADLGRAVEKFKSDFEKNGAIALQDLMKLKEAADKNYANSAKEQVVQTLVNHFDDISKLDKSPTGKISDGALNKLVDLEKNTIKEERLWRGAVALIHDAPFFLTLDRNGEAHVSAEALKKWQNHPANSLAVNNTIDFLLDKINSGQDLTRRSLEENSQRLSQSSQFKTALEANFKHSSQTQEVARIIQELKLEAELMAIPAVFSVVAAAVGARGAEVPLFFTGVPASAKAYQTYDEYCRSRDGIAAARRYQFEKNMALD